MLPVSPPFNRLRIWKFPGNACLLVAFALASIIGATTDVRAADLFSVRVTVGGETVTRGFANAEEALRLVESDELENPFPDYRETDAVSAEIQFRGLPVAAHFDEDSNALVFKIPSLDIEERFDAETRQASIDAFVDFIKKDGQAIVDRLQRELARVSPVDPVAGNPASLQSMLVKDAFESGGFATGVERPQSRFGLGVSGGTFRAGDFSGRSLTLPLSYAIGLDSSEPRMKLRLKLPLTWQDVEGAAIYAAAPSIAFTWPVTEAWALTPGVSWGATGSVDAASVAHMFGGSLTSDYRITDGVGTGATLAIANMVGHVRALPFSFRGFEFDPGLRNTVLKNGVSYESPTGVALFGDAGLTAQISYAHSWFFGSDLFLNRYNEVALSLGAPLEAMDPITDELRFGAAWTFGKDYSGLSANLGYEF